MMREMVDSKLSKTLEPLIKDVAVKASELNTAKARLIQAIERAAEEGNCMVDHAAYLIIDDLASGQYAADICGDLNVQDALNDIAEDVYNEVVSYMYNDDET